MFTYVITIKLFVLFVSHTIVSPRTSSLVLLLQMKAQL